MSITDNNRLYTGRSMEGTFRCGDLLEVQPVSLEEVFPGDVVVYHETNHRGQVAVVHRAIGVCPDGMTLRGDNNRCKDPTLLTEANLVGKVSGLTRNGKRIPVCGRRLGLMRARVRHAWLYVRRAIGGRIRRIGRNVYYHIYGPRLIALIWRPTTTKIRLMTGDKMLVKYVCRHRTVATHQVELDRFVCRRPFGLLLSRCFRGRDASHLPIEWVKKFPYLGN